MSAILLSASAVALGPANAAEPSGCIANDDGTLINKTLQEGGQGATVTLCAGSTIKLQQRIVLTANGQTVTSDPQNRATVILDSPTLMQAITTRSRSNATISNIVFNGNRAERSEADVPSQALIELGAITNEDGKVSNIMVDNIKAIKSRRGALLHVLRYNNCSNATIQNSVFEDAGYDFTDNVGLKVNDVVPGQSWADGVRLDCSNSVVRNNTIIDSTDAAIVIFGSPGSVVENNHIIQRSKTLLGAINLVDNTTRGNFTGVVVRNNLISAEGGLIRSAIGMGNPVWSCGNKDVGPFYGAVITGNKLEGTTMGWGFSATRVKDWTVTGNVDNSTHNGIASVQCDGYYSLPSGFDFAESSGNPINKVAGTFQPEFRDAHIDDLLFFTDPFSKCMSVNMKTPNQAGSYFSLSSAGLLENSASTAEAGESFTPIMSGLSTVKLRANSTGKFLSVNGDGSVTLTADPTDSSSNFLMIRLRNSEKSFGLKSVLTGKWLAPNASKQLTATKAIPVGVSDQDGIPWIDVTVSGPCDEAVSWKKVDENGAPLAGSQWILKDNQGAVKTIVDNGEGDSDEAVGAIRVGNLPWGNYELSESVAPQGFDLDSSTRQVSIDGMTSTVDLDEVVNKKIATISPTPSSTPSTEPSPSVTPSTSPSVSLPPSTQASLPAPVGSSGATATATPTKASQMPTLEAGEATSAPATADNSENSELPSTGYEDMILIAGAAVLILGGLTLSSVSIRRRS